MSALENYSSNLDKSKYYSKWGKHIFLHKTNQKRGRTESNKTGMI